MSERTLQDVTLNKKLLFFYFDDSNAETQDKQNSIAE